MQTSRNVQLIAKAENLLAIQPEMTEALGLALLVLGPHCAFPVISFL